MLISLMLCKLIVAKRTLTKIKLEPFSQSSTSTSDADNLISVKQH